MQIPLMQLSLAVAITVATTIIAAIAFALAAAIAAAIALAFLSPSPQPPLMSPPALVRRRLMLGLAVTTARQGAAPWSSRHGKEVWRYLRRGLKESGGVCGLIG